jgi:hypothetical protein
LSALTTLVDLSKSRTSKRCNLLVRHKKNVDAVTRQRPRRTGLAHTCSGRVRPRPRALATQPPTPPSLVLGTDGDNGINRALQAKVPMPTVRK